MKNLLSIMNTCIFLLVFPTIGFAGLTGEIELENCTVDADGWITGQVVESSIAGVEDGEWITISDYWQEPGTSVPASGKLLCSNVRDGDGGTEEKPGRVSAPKGQKISCEEPEEDDPDEQEEEQSGGVR